ncbi:cytochrome c3 family protein [Desulfitobacterium sp. THU1]|uniref:cytochrome c3 family protein n=1 Tax=Desulfitobacterium sp. THU1 TaxID=3138072 RepID=UPI00311E336E
MFKNEGGSLKGKLLVLMLGLLVIIVAVIGCTTQNKNQPNQPNIQQGSQPPTTQTADRQNNSHSKMGVKCEQCHVTEGKPVTKQQCQSCHKNIEDLRAKTKDMDPNPHGPHHYDLEDCTICHSVHGKSQMMCSQCHDFPWIKELDKEWEIVGETKQ